jgi:hypothetical protein
MGVKRGIFLFIREEYKLHVWERNIDKQIIWTHEESKRAI